MGNLLRPVLVLDGSQTWPCDGQFHWSDPFPINGKVAKVFLFASMNPNDVNGADVILWSPKYGGWGALADCHLYVRTPSQALQSQCERTFSPDRVEVDTVQAGIIAWGGGTILVYAEVFVEIE